MGWRVASREGVSLTIVKAPTPPHPPRPPPPPASPRLPVLQRHGAAGARGVPAAHDRRGQRCDRRDDGGAAALRRRRRQDRHRPRQRLHDAAADGRRVPPALGASHRPACLPLLPGGGPCALWTRSLRCANTPLPPLPPLAVQALLECADAAHGLNGHIISDGGARTGVLFLVL